MRIGEIAHDFRYESSGTLKGIERGRHFCQNDAHLFCTPEQIKSEVADVCNLIFEVYKDFNITDYRCVLSLRDPADKKKYHDDDAMWNHAESALREVLTELGINFTEEIGEAAFYGPKLDIQYKNVYGKEDTLVTIQIDMLLAQRFGMYYTDTDGQKKLPYIIHRTSLGCYERTLAYMIEHFAGAMPLWIAPEQVRLIPIADRHLDYTYEVLHQLQAAGLRCEVDSRAEKVGYKIRQAVLEKVPYMITIGDNEVEQKTVAVRSRKNGDLGSMQLDDLLAKLKEEVDTKAK